MKISECYVLIVHSLSMVIYGLVKKRIRILMSFIIGKKCVEEYVIQYVLSMYGVHSWTN